MRAPLAILASLALALAAYIGGRLAARAFDSLNKLARAREAS